MATPNWNVMKSLYAPIPEMGGGQSGMPSTARRSSGSPSDSKEDEGDIPEMYPLAAEQYLESISMLEMEQRAIKSKMQKYLYDSNDITRAADSPEFKKLNQQYFQIESTKNKVKAQKSYSEAVLEEGRKLMGDKVYAPLVYMDIYGNTIGRNKEGKITSDQDEIITPMTNLEAMDWFGSNITNLGEGMRFGASYDPNAWETNITALFNSAGKTEGIDVEFDKTVSEAYRALVPNAKDFLITATKNWDQLNAFGSQILKSMSFEDMRSAKGTFYNVMRTTNKEVLEIDPKTETLVADVYTQKDFNNKTIDKITGKPIVKEQVGEAKQEPWKMKDFNEWFATNLQLLKQGESEVSISKMAIPAKGDGTEDGDGLEEKPVNYWTMVGTKTIFDQAGTRVIYTTGNASKAGGISPMQHSLVIDPLFLDEKIKLEGTVIYGFDDRTNKQLDFWSHWWHKTGKAMSSTPITISGIKYQSPRAYAEEMMSGAIEADQVLQVNNKYINTDYIIDVKENTNSRNDTDAIARQIQTSTTLAYPWEWIDHRDTDEYYKSSPWAGTMLHNLDVIIPGKGFSDPEQIKLPDGGYILGIKGFFRGPGRDFDTKNLQLYSVLWTMMSEDDMKATKLKVKKARVVSDSDYWTQRDNPDLGIHEMSNKEDLLVQSLKTRIPGMFTDLRENEPFYDVKKSLGNYYLVPMIVAGSNYYTQAATTPRPKEQVPPLRK